MPMMHLFLVLILVELRLKLLLVRSANTSRHTQDGAALTVYSQLMMMLPHTAKVLLSKQHKIYSDLSHWTNFSSTAT